MHLLMETKMELAYHLYKIARNELEGRERKCETRNGMTPIMTARNR